MLKKWIEENKGEIIEDLKKTFYKSTGIEVDSDCFEELLKSAKITEK